MKTIDNNAVKIRRLTSSDITSTLGIWWAEIPEKEMVASQVQGLLDLSFLAEYEGTLVGFILARLEYAGVPMTGTGVVFLIAVHPDYQKSGIGTMLFEALEKYAGSRGIAVIRAILPQKEIKTIRFFTKAGFTKSAMINYDKICR
jgi:ribosomal protein S18 acetylase RimI-like enzyme